MESAFVIPDEDPIVATDVLLLLQVPPVVLLLKVEFPPVHNEVVPVIAEGKGLTVTPAVAATLPQLFVAV